VKTSVLILSMLFSILSPSAFSKGGASSAGGGDLQCDARIQTIASNIGSWIQGQGPEVGKVDLSSSQNPANGSKPYTLAQYDSAMMKLLAKPLDVSCVSQGTPGIPFWPRQMVILVTKARLSG
jgi:hypothetical protein